MIDALRKQLIEHEGWRLKPYRCTAGYLTIGCGRNLDANGIRHDEALLMLDNDIASCIGQLRSRLHWFEHLNEIRQRVLIDMAFQLGINGLLKFKRTLSLIESGRYEDAAFAMLQSLWAKQTPNRAKRLAAWMRTGIANA